jgi:hypothetical protein
VSDAFYFSDEDTYIDVCTDQTKNLDLDDAIKVMAYADWLEGLLTEEEMKEHVS